MITLFSKIVEIFKKENLKELNFLKENFEPSRIFLFVKMKISKLINYPTNMCQSCQDGTIPDKYNKKKRRCVLEKMKCSLLVNNLFFKTPLVCENYVM